MSEVKRYVQVGLDMELRDDLKQQEWVRAEDYEKARSEDREEYRRELIASVPDRVMYALEEAVRHQATLKSAKAQSDYAKLIFAVMLEAATSTVREVGKAEAIRREGYESELYDIGFKDAIEKAVEKLESWHGEGESGSTPRTHGEDQ